MNKGVFGRSYADAYDLLYSDKDYEHECDFLQGVFGRIGADVRSILDLGCGTGGHAIPLAQRGYRVVGVDRSREMLDIARAKAAANGVEIEFHQGDLRDVRLDETFDAVIAMFAVMSYQIGNADLAAACETARHHLRSRGVFFFDAWHGPGVIADPPTPRYRSVENEGVRIIRFTEPKIDVVSHTVETRFNVIRIRNTTVEDEFNESHFMRYLFPNEIGRYLELAGFEPPAFYSFANLDSVPSRDTWQLAVAARVSGP